MAYLERNVTSPACSVVRPTSCRHLHGLLHTHVVHGTCARTHTHTHTHEEEKKFPTFNPTPKWKGRKGYTSGRSITFCMPVFSSCSPLTLYLHLFMCAVCGFHDEAYISLFSQAGSSKPRVYPPRSLTGATATRMAASFTRLGNRYRPRNPAQMKPYVFYG